MDSPQELADRELLAEAMARSGPIAKRWGEKVELTRLAIGWSRSQLSSLVGVSPATVWKWERGYRVPSDAAKCGIAAALGCEVARLFPMPTLDEINTHYLTEDYHRRRQATIVEVAA